MAFTVGKGEVEGFDVDFLADDRHSTCARSLPRKLHRDDDG